VFCSNTIAAPVTPPRRSRLAEGDALTVQSSGDLGPSRIVERPKVISTSYSEAKVGVAESSTPCGPYTHLGSSRLFADYEAPAMVKANGRYYILASHLACWSTNDDVYASSTSLSSGWTSFANFARVGTETYNTQVGNISPVQGSSGTTYIYAGDRWTTSDLGGPR
jgi:hypothetical protein